MRAAARCLCMLALFTDHSYIVHDFNKKSGVLLKVCDAMYER